MLGSFRRRSRTNRTEDEPLSESADSLARRRVLRLGGLAAAGAAGAALVSVVDAAPSGAATGGPLLLGNSNDAGGDNTQLTSAGVFSFAVTNTGAATAVQGSSPTGLGVRAASNSGTGLAASSGTGVAVTATTETPTGVNAAIVAQSGGKGQAVLAVNTAAATTPTVQSLSLSAQPALQATGKTVPVSAAVPVAGNAAALNVKGVAAFTRSGTAVISATFLSVVVNVPGGLTATSHVLATMQTHLASGTPRVLAAVPNPANGKITIFLDAPVPSMQTVKIAWFVFG
jgi:hypothetical protein